MTGRPNTTRSRGFTLLEVLIAMALMAVLAVLSWRGLDSVLVTRERLTRASDDLKALSVCFTQMEEDLRRAWPVRLLNLAAAPIGFAQQGADDGAPPLQLMREPPAGQAAGTVQRVSYRLRAGIIERGFAAWAPVSPDNVATTAVDTFSWQPLLGDVRAFRMRGFLAGQGWVDAATLASRPPPTSIVNTAPGALPVAPTLVSGLEVVIERGNGERVTRIFSVKD